MEIKQHILKQPWIKEEITWGIRKDLETNEDENTTYQNLWNAKKSSTKRGVYSGKCLH